MRNELLTKTRVKRETAAAITCAQARNGWSNEDAGDALGCCGNTIRNRTDVDDPGKQMTVYELLRSLTTDSEIARHLLALVGFEPVRMAALPDATTDRQKSSSITRANLAVSEMLEDDEITDQEIRERRAELEAGREAFDCLLRRITPRAVGEGR